MNYWEKATFMLQQNMHENTWIISLKSVHRKFLTLAVAYYAQFKGQYAFLSVCTQFISACVADNITAVMQCCVSCLK